MLDERGLSELLRYEPGHPMLSVYVDRNPSERAGWALQLRSLGRTLPPESADDLRRVEKHLEMESDPEGRSAAVFSCAADNFFRAYAFPLPLRGRARWLPRPYVKPLADLMDSFGGYGVAVVDKQSVRLFHFHLGALIESEHAEAEDVRRMKSGGSAAVRGTRGGNAELERREAEQTQRNTQKLAETAARFFTERAVRRILIGGTDENTATFRAALPKTWQSLAVGTIPVQKDELYAAIRERAMKVAVEAERAREGAVVAQAITAAAKGQGGAVGLGDTLRAIKDGRVHTLIIGEGFRASGKRCAACGHLEADGADRCPLCGGEFQAIPDAVELAVEAVWGAGGEVEVVHADPALEKAGRIAALLRY